MQEEVRFFMITVLKDKTLFANIYEDHDEFLSAFNSFKDKYAVGLWELRKVSGDNFDLVVAKKDDGWVVCLNPLERIGDDDPDFVKCVKKEVVVSS